MINNEVRPWWEHIKKKIRRSRTSFHEIRVHALVSNPKHVLTENVYVYDLGRKSQNYIQKNLNCATDFNYKGVLRAVSF